jgi:hypothetical protein
MYKFLFFCILEPEIMLTHLATFAFGRRKMVPCLGYCPDPAIEHLELLVEVAKDHGGSENAAKQKHDQKPGFKAAEYRLICADGFFNHEHIKCEKTGNWTINGVTCRR